MNAARGAEDCIYPIVFTGGTAPPPAAAEEDLRPYYMLLFLEQYEAFRASGCAFPLQRSVAELRTSDPQHAAEHVAELAAFADYIRGYWDPTSDADFAQLGASVITSVATVVKAFQEERPGAQLTLAAAREALRALGIDTPNSRIQRRTLKLDAKRRLNVKAGAWIARKRPRLGIESATASDQQATSECASA